jgi:hypothetical protein
VLDTPLQGCDCTDGAPDQQYTCADQVPYLCSQSPLLVSSPPKQLYTAC